MSTERTVIDKEFLICVFCQELPQEPRVLSCLHSICAACAKSQLSGSNTWTSCPKCKESLIISDSEKLPPNYWLKNVIDNINITESSERKICTFCKLKGKEREAVAKCLTCYDLLCKECSENFHTFTTQTKDHEVVSITDLRSEQFNREIKSQRQIVCLEHDKEHLRYFCRTCDVPVCRDCIIFKHNSHDLISSKEGLEQFEKSLQLELERIQKDLTPLKTQYLKIIDQTNDIQNHEENVKLQIETTCNAMINKISARRRSLERDLAQTLTKTKENLARETESEAKKIRTLEMTMSFCKSMLKHGNDLEILTLQTAVKQRIQKISSAEDRVFSIDFRNIIPKLNATWKDPHLELCYKTEVDGRLNDDVKSSAEDKDVRINNEHGMQENVSGFSAISINDGKKFDNDSCLNKDNTANDSEESKLPNKTYKDVTCSFITSNVLVSMFQRPKISSVSWVNEDSFIATDQCNNNVHLCSLTSPGKVMMLQNCIDSVVTSWCYAVRTGSREVVVFDWNSSFLFNLSNVSIVAAASPISPFFACISKSSVSIKTSRDMPLQCMAFKDSSRSPLCMGNPRFGCLLTSGKLAVSDWDKDFVYFFNENAVLFRKEFCSPGPIANDKDDLIYITDIFEHLIIVTDFQGSFRQTVNLLPHAFHPRSISISPNYKLAVAFENKIALFHLNKNSNS